jgi:hypothetical protein
VAGLVQLVQARRVCMWKCTNLSYKHSKRPGTVQGRLLLQRGKGDELHAVVGSQLTALVVTECSTADAKAMRPIQVHDVPLGVCEHVVHVGWSLAVPDSYTLPWLVSMLSLIVVPCAVAPG